MCCSSCRNLGLQRGETKKLRVEESEVEGWGLFAAEQIFKNELIGEYLGEIVSQDEANRRGSVYDKVNVSYLFNLNSGDYF
jgi:SET domain-containing protein